MLSLVVPCALVGIKISPSLGFIYNKGDKMQQLRRRQRDGYLAVISRFRIDRKNTDRIFSEQFVSGKPAISLKIQVLTTGFLH